MEFIGYSSARGPDVAIEVLLPKLGLTMESGLIEEWLVSAGTLVKPGEPLMRLATDKVEVDVEAEAEGLFHPAVAQGSELPPGALVGWLLAEGEAVPATSVAAPTAAGGSAADRGDGGRRRARRADATDPNRPPVRVAQRPAGCP